jgi:hypothetical protein
MSDKEDSTHEKTDDNSDAVSELNDDQKKKLEDDEVSQISKEATNNYVTTEFKDKVINYVKIDDLIKKKTEEIKELKSKKKPCEEYIIRFLEKQEADHVNVIGGRLVKNSSETKGALKTDIIKEAIKEGIQTKKLVDSNDIEKKNTDTNKS